MGDFAPTTEKRKMVFLKMVPCRVAVNPNSARPSACLTHHPELEPVLLGSVVKLSRQVWVGNVTVGCSIWVCYVQLAVSTVHKLEGRVRTSRRDRGHLRRCLHRVHSSLNSASRAAWNMSRYACTMCMDVAAGTPTYESLIALKPCQR